MDNKQLDLFAEAREVPLRKIRRPWVWYLDKCRVLRVRLLGSGKLYLEVVKSNPNTGRDRWLFDREYDNTQSGVSALAKDMGHYGAQLPDYSITEAELFRDRHYSVGERLLIQERGPDPIAVYYLIRGRLIAPVWSDYEQNIFKPERDFGLDRYLDMPAVVHAHKHIADRLIMKLSAGYRIFVIVEDDTATEFTDEAGIRIFAESIDAPDDWDGDAEE